MHEKKLPAKSLRVDDWETHACVLLLNFRVNRTLTVVYGVVECYSRDHIFIAKYKVLKDVWYLIVHSKVVISCKISHGILQCSNRRIDFK